MIGRAEFFVVLAFLIAHHYITQSLNPLREAKH
jgi:hypothetical protein